MEPTTKNKKKLKVENRYVCCGGFVAERTDSCGQQTSKLEDSLVNLQLNTY